MQNMTPEGGHRGRVSLRSGGNDVLDTGTESLEWKRAKELPLGPNGAKGWTGLSEAKTEVPSLAWVETTRRGGGSLYVVDMLFEMC